MNRSMNTSNPYKTFINSAVFVSVEGNDEKEPEREREKKDVVFVPLITEMAIIITEKGVI